MNRILIELKLVFVILILVGLESAAQKLPPIMDYNESGYTVSELKNFSTGLSEYSKNYYQAELDIINDGLRKSGRASKLKEFPLVSGRHNDWTFDHINFAKLGILPIKTQ